MTSAIEIVPLLGDDMISPKKRVRKAIIKPKNSEKSEKMAEKLEKPFPEPIIQQKIAEKLEKPFLEPIICLLYTSPSPRDRTRSRMPSSA